MVLCKDLVIQYVPFLDQLADILTKHLPSFWFIELSKLTVLPGQFILRSGGRLTNS